MRCSRKLLLQFVVIMLSGALVPNVLFAGGLTQYEVATPDAGYASAGYAGQRLEIGIESGNITFEERQPSF